MDTQEATEVPAIDPALYERLRGALASAGPAAAVDRLVADLREAGDYQNLFYALLLKKRVELGVSPFPTGPSADLPAHTHEPYEQAIRAAGREVGQALLERRQYGQAWAFFRMLGEPEPMRAALEAYAPGPDEDVYPVIEIAWQNAVLPKKGFDLVLDRNGVCSAITMVSSSDITGNADLRDYCVGRLARRSTSNSPKGSATTRRDAASSSRPKRPSAGSLPTIPSSSRRTRTTSIRRTSPASCR